MRLSLTSRALALLTLAVALTGCSKSPAAPGSSGSTDQTLVQSGLSASINLVADDVMNATSSTQLFGLAPAGSNAAIDPRFFFRVITHNTRSFAFAFSDSDSTGRPLLADVTVTNHMTGMFNILKALPNDSSHVDSSNVVQKPLDDSWVRHLRLRRVRGADSVHTEWHVVAVSGAVVTSAGATSSITSVRVQTANLDTTITDASQLWSLARSCQVAAGDTLRITATTPRMDDVVLAYWHDHRERFRNNGDGTYTFTLHVADGDSGYRWFGVNVLSRGTLYDDALPYDSKAWIMHCFVGERPTGEFFN